MIFDFLFWIELFQSQILIDDCIEFMGIWLLHVLRFSVEQASPWRLVNGHTACMGI